MPDVLHRVLGPGENHIIHDWERPDEAGRLAIPVTEVDVGRVCRQLSDDSFWILARVAGGVVWREWGAGSGGMTPAQVAQLDTATSDIDALDGPPSDPLNIRKTAALPGTSAAAARADHQHNVDTAAPTFITAANTNSEGVAETLARADHIHALDPADRAKLDALDGSFIELSDAVPATVNAEDSYVGLAADAARADHRHRVSAGVPVKLTAGTEVSEGSSNAFARADHVHALAAADRAKIDNIVVVAFDQPATVDAGSPSAGTFPTTKGSAFDHKHAVLVAPPIAIASSGTVHVGSSDALARADHVHVLDPEDRARLDAAVIISTAAPANVDAGPASGGTTGSGGAARDHRHSVTVAQPVAVGAANDEGSSAALARADHIHAHGNQAGGALHALVEAGGTSGFMSGADKLRLDNMQGMTLATPSVSTGTVNIATSSDTGTSPNAARQDHTHGHGTLGGGTMHAIADTSNAGFMSASMVQRLGGMGTLGEPNEPSATSLGAVSSSGNSPSAARVDHVHTHGVQPGGALHATATAHTGSLVGGVFTTGGTNGFISATDKTRLDALNANAATVDTATAPQPVDAGTASPGSGTAAAAANHKHSVTIAAPVTVGTANAQGTGTALALATHVHAHGDQAGGTLHALAAAHTATPVGGLNTTGGTHGFMSADAATKLAAVNLSSAGAPVGNTAPAPVFPQTAAPGISTEAARADHKHDVTVAAPVAIGTANAEGNATSLARSNHVHAHGDQLGGTLHALATVHTATPVSGVNTTGGVAGFMSPDMATKLAGLSGVPGATIDYEIVSVPGLAVTLGLTHRGKLLVCTGAGATVITVPRDSTTNLPLGFTCTVVVVGVEGTAEFVSEVNSGVYGTPTRYAAAYSDNTTSPKRIYANAHAFQTIVKVAADTWVAAGHYVP